MGTPDENSSVYELKAYVENILKRLGLDLHNLVVGNLTDDIFATALSVHTKGEASCLFRCCDEETAESIRYR